MEISHISTFLFDFNIFFPDFLLLSTGRKHFKKLIDMVYNLILACREKALKKRF